MDPKTLIDCLNTLQISRGKKIVSVRDIKEIPGHGWNYTMEYIVTNSRYTYSETTFNNLIPRDVFLNYLQTHPQTSQTKEDETEKETNPTELNLDEGVDEIKNENELLNDIMGDAEKTDPKVLKIITTKGIETTITEDEHKKMIEIHGEENLPYYVDQE